jgi:hypothetical protein
MDVHATGGQAVLIGRCLAALSAAGCYGQPPYDAALSLAPRRAVTTRDAACFT